MEVNCRAGVEADGEASHLQKRQQKENEEEKKTRGMLGRANKRQKKKFGAAIRLPI